MARHRQRIALSCSLLAMDGGAANTCFMALWIDAAGFNLSICRSYCIAGTSKLANPACIRYAFWVVFFAVLPIKAAACAVKQVPGFDGLSFDPFSLFQDDLAAPEIYIGRGEVLQAFVIALVVVVLDDGHWFWIERSRLSSL